MEDQVRQVLLVPPVQLDLLVLKDQQVLLVLLVLLVLPVLLVRPVHLLLLRE
jgi:hypothetical protein